MTRASALEFSAAAELHHPQQMERKLKKPLMEKKRRARINRSLFELKSLLLHDGGPQSAKLEKADILEMTVSHIKEQQQAKFLEGYDRCAQAVIDFLRTAEPRLIGEMSKHLRVACTSSEVVPRISSQPFPQHATYSPYSRIHRPVPVPSSSGQSVILQLPPVGVQQSRFVPNARSATPPFRLDSISSDASSLSPLSCSTDAQSPDPFTPVTPTLPRGSALWRPW